MRVGWCQPQLFCQELHAQGVAAGRHRIARLMRQAGIVACTERRFRWTATARAELPAAPDRLRRDFTAAAPNQRWVADITSVRTGQGRLHLAIVLDLYARRIVGWAMAPTLDQHLAADALAMALADRRPAPGSSSTPIGAGCTSPRGSSTNSRRIGPSPAPVGRAAASTTPWPSASSTRSRPNSSISTATARARRRAWRSSNTSRPSTIAAVGTRAMATAHPTITKLTTSSAGPNRVSPFLGQLQSAACAG